MHSRQAERILRRLWRALPRRQRHVSLFWALYPFAARRRNPPGGEPLVCVAGPLSAPTGIARGARANLSVLRRAAGAVVAADASRMLGYHEAPSAGIAGATDPPPRAEATHLILHANPLQVPVCALWLGDTWRRARRVGLWAWELPTVPPEWGAAARLLDEIWVPSRFVEGVLRDAGIDRPIRVMPPPVLAIADDAAQRGTPPPPPGSRERLRFVIVFDARSGFWRKNPIDAVRAFRKTLGDAPDAELVVKVTGADRHPAGMTKLRYAVGGTPNVRVVTDVLSDREMADLMGSADVVLSTHRSEGFGLVMFEGMLHGRVVVATGWSGNMDFMDEANSIPLGYGLTPVFDPDRIYSSKRNVWAQPDIGHLCDVLRDLHAHRDRLAPIGAAARRSAEAFSREAARRQIAWLEEIRVGRETPAAAPVAAPAAPADDAIPEPAPRLRSRGGGR